MNSVLLIDFRFPAHWRLSRAAIAVVESFFRAAVEVGGTDCHADAEQSTLSECGARGQTPTGAAEAAR